MMMKDKTHIASLKQLVEKSSKNTYLYYFYLSYSGHLSISSICMISLVLLTAITRFLHQLKLINCYGLSSIFPHFQWLNISNRTMCSLIIAMLSNIYDFCYSCLFSRPIPVLSQNGNFPSELEYNALTEFYAQHAAYSLPMGLPSLAMEPQPLAPAYPADYAPVPFYFDSDTYSNTNSLSGPPPLESLTPPPFLIHTTLPMYQF